MVHLTTRAARKSSAMVMFERGNNKRPARRSRHDRYYAASFQRTTG